MESYSIYVPEPISSYEDWSHMFQVEEIKEKGELQELDGIKWWVFQTKWGQAYYMEEEENGSDSADYRTAASLQIYLDEWIVGENHYNGIFSINRYVDNYIGGEEWSYEYKNFY